MKHTAAWANPCHKYGVTNKQFEAANKIIDILALANNVKIKQIWLVGSTIRGTARPDSDIDIVVFTDQLKYDSSMAASFYADGRQMTVKFVPDKESGHNTIKVGDREFNLAHCNWLTGERTALTADDEEFWQYRHNISGVKTIRINKQED